MSKLDCFQPGALWPDENGDHINAHGGGLLRDSDRYYWFGEKRGAHESLGINVYSSDDLYNWRFEKLALAPVEDDPEHDLALGCVMERPKVLFNEKTNTYVMWFHLELKGQGYSAARAATAVSDAITGPYRFLHSFRPNGNMSRDMTLYQDEDGAAYHIYSSRDNYDLRVCRLSDDFLTPTSQDQLVLSEHREAPALFKHDGRYHLITSACTGWKSNIAKLHIADSLFGPWRDLGNPCRGPRADLTFDAQSTFILPISNHTGEFIFLADRWNPENLADSRYLWLPLDIAPDNITIPWLNRWDLTHFTPH